MALITGCKGERNPLAAGDEMSFIRSAQFFDGGTEWGPGYSLDSASTTWVYPVPTGICYGDIAVEDEINGSTVSPDVTAFVRHDSPTAPSDIHLTLIQGDEVVYSTVISEPIGLQPLCRHPAVEVTYEREDEEDTGLLKIHVVWSQYNPYAFPSANWDVYYREILFYVTQYGINWSLPSYDQVKLPACTGYDEIEPDIFVHPAINYLYAVCLVRNQGSPTDDLIVAANHDAEGESGVSVWNEEYIVNGSAERERGSPRIDGGLFNMPEESMPLYGWITAVWCEKLSDDPYPNWQVFGNFWEPQEEADPDVAYRISWPTQQYEISFLPQIDVTPFSSDINEAVIVWSSAEWDDEEEEFVNQNTQITATPYLIDSVYQFTGSRYSRCQDVACYQMSDEEEHWFGIAYYHSDDESDPEEDWLVWARSFSFYIDEQLDEAVFDEELYTYIGDTNGQWDPDNPFTGATLCLQIPDEEYPEDSFFGLGWIDEGYDAYIGAGQIQ